MKRRRQKRKIKISKPSKKTLSSPSLPPPDYTGGIDGARRDVARRVLVGRSLRWIADDTYRLFKLETILSPELWEAQVKGIVNETLANRADKSHSNGSASVESVNSLVGTPS